MFENPSHWQMAIIDSNKEEEEEEEEEEDEWRVIRYTARKLPAQAKPAAFITL